MTRQSFKSLPVWFIYSFIIVLVSLMSAVSVSHAHSAKYLEHEVYRDIWAKSPLDIYFSADKRLCVEAYGEDWREKCSAWLGKSGSVVQDLVTPDWPEGEWLWLNPSHLRFTPSQSWKSDTKYEVDLGKLSLPDYVVLSSDTVSFTTIATSSQMNEAKLWIDPSNKAEHAISFSMRFTESLDKNIREHLQENVWPVAKDSQGLELSKGEWVWLDDNTRAVVNSRILRLPKKDSLITLTLPKIHQLLHKNGHWRIAERDASKELIIAGTNSLFRLENMALDTWQNKALETEQHITFRFSQRVGVDELLKSLTVLELPLYRSEENIKPTDWHDGEISQDVLEKARKLKPELVRLSGESLDIVRFRLNVKEGHYIYWNLEAGFGPTSDKGVKTPLAKSVDGVNFIPFSPARLDLLQTGTVLMKDSDIALVSEHLDSIRWSAHRFMDNSLALPFLTYLDRRLTAHERNSIAEVTRGEITFETQQSKSEKEGIFSKPVFTTLLAKDVFGTSDNGGQEVESGLIYLHLEGIKDGRVVTELGRVLMYSNMGLVLKTLPNNTMQAYICELDSAKPLKDVYIQVIGYNGVAVLEVKTDSEGKAILPDMSNFSEEKQPVAIVARRVEEDSFNHKDVETAITEDMLWISLKDYERYVNLSQFADLGGKQSSVNLLNAFVFAERGLFRPGEKLHFGTLLRANDWKLLPKDMPLVAIIRDEAGRKVFEESFKAGENIHSFTWQIPESVMTGRYRLSVSTPSENNSGLILGDTTVNIEMFLPDTLRLKTELIDTEKSDESDDKIKNTTNTAWLQTSENKGTMALQVQLDTLFGQVAQNRRVTSLMRLSPAYLNFKGYEDYIFQDVSPYFGTGIEPISRPLKATVTDDKGQAIIGLDFSQWRFGTLQCSIFTEAYEPAGGRAVSQEKRFLLSPMPYMLGYKTGEGAENKDFILKDSQAKLHFQAINPELQGVKLNDLTFSISRRETILSLVSDSLGQYTYDETVLETEISQNKENLSEKGDYVWEIPSNEIGDYVLTVKANISGADTILSQVAYSIVGNDDLRPALMHNNRLPKAHLHIKTDKESYKGADTAKIMINAPYDGVALISLERDTVEAHKWVKLSAGSSMHELKIPEDFTGRAYIQVLMGRAPESDSIFLQAQSVAMASISVNAKAREIPLEITTIDLKKDEKAKPNKPLRLRIKNKENKATKAIIFAVDEGILQLSKFNTPQPLNYLLLDRALEVRTAQLFDRFMPHDKKVMKRLSAFGGDAAQSDMFRSLLGSFQNPFKRKNEAPMTWWSGVVDIPADGLEIEIPIPYYFNGTLRLMAVAHNEEGVGHAQERVIVQDEQVLTTQVPSMLALGDSFSGGLSVSNTTDKPITLKTSLTLSDNSDMGNSGMSNSIKDMDFYNFPANISLKAKEEKYISFNAKVGQELGNAVLLFRTEDEKGGIRERVATISIRPTSLARYSQHSFMLEQSTSIHAIRSLLPYDAQSSLTVSPIPLPLLQSSLNYLKNYPYNCVEQSISKAFPLVALSKKDKNTSQLASLLEKNVSSLQTKEKEEIIKNAHNAIMLAFNPYQGMSLWENTQKIDLFLTAYAADYVLTLKEAGLSIPPNTLPQLFNTLERNINESPYSLRDLRALSYASWVLARAGYVVSRQLELCENYIRRENLIKSDIYHSFMAGAYHALYMENDAKRHLQRVAGQALENWDASTGMFDTLAQYGLHARILAKHFPSEFENVTPFIQKCFLESLNKSHATLGASMAALGLISMVETLQNSQFDMQNITLRCAEYETAENLEKVEANAEISKHIYTLNAPLCARFDIDMKSGQKYFAQIEYNGYDKEMPKDALQKGLRIEQSFSLDSGNVSANTNENGSHNEVFVTNIPSVNKVKQGEVLRVDVDISLLTDSEIPVAIVSILPGGFELVLDHKNDTRASQVLSLMREEDRVIAFIDATRKTKRISYHIRAIAQGEFAVPPAHSEGLFDRTVQSNTAGGRIIIE